MAVIDNLKFGIKRIHWLIVQVLLLPVWLYVYAISPLFPVKCRFYPSCSQYFIESIRHLGVIKGLFFGIYRILRCSPLSDGGYDPVPSSSKHHKCAKQQSLKPKLYALVFSKNVKK